MITKTISLLNKIKHRFYIKLDVLSLNIHVRNKSIKVSRDLLFTEVFKSDLDSIFELEENHQLIEHKESLYKKLKENGVRLFFVLKDKKIAGYSFIDTTKIFESATGYKSDLKKGEAYLFKDYTFDDFRGIGVHKFSVFKRLEVLESEGYETVFVTIYSDNYYSQKSYLKNGFEKKFSMLYFKLFGRTFILKRNLNNE